MNEYSVSWSKVFKNFGVKCYLNANKECLTGLNGKMSLATKRNKPTPKLNKQTKKLSQPTTTPFSLSIYQHCDVFWVIITVA